MNNLHLNLSTNLPEHIVANATLIENTRIFPELSLIKLYDLLIIVQYIIFQKNTYLPSVGS